MRRPSAKAVADVPWTPPTSWLVSQTVVETAEGRVLEEPAVDRLAHSIRCHVEKHYPRGARVRVTLEALHG